jgi:hypothetical protein
MGALDIFVSELYKVGMGEPMARRSVSSKVQAKRAAKGLAPLSPTSAPPPKPVGGFADPGYSRQKQEEANKLWQKQHPDPYAPVPKQPKKSAPKASEKVDYPSLHKRAPVLDPGGGGALGGSFTKKMNEQVMADQQARAAAAKGAVPASVPAAPAPAPKVPDPVVKAPAPAPPAPAAKAPAPVANAPAPTPPAPAPAPSSSAGAPVQPPVQADKPADPQKAGNFPTFRAIGRGVKNVGKGAALGVGLGGIYAVSQAARGLREGEERNR